MATNRTSQLRSPDLFEQAAGLRRAHEILQQLHEGATREHKALPGTFLLGRPRRRHHELMAVSRMLREAGAQLMNEHAVLLRTAKDGAHKAFLDAAREGSATSSNGGE
ncbi:hypothetical protein [Shinella sp. JR1-6]|uniref:hypothetical protein n=1 Tax=Shinella sp. JR1-6 TaxID=2527671 RepID=UPI00102D5C47|nr:hypothetical protein [Shinella sp. JR1-6]TAA54611.1 hypothetical protein EXZ48_26665 [Shinella sp. JR1-6]